MNGPSDAYLDLLNEILKTTDAIGAYCIGRASTMAWHAGLEPDYQLLVAAAKCSGVFAVPVIFDAWKKGRAA
jgi:hypothetical protein